MSRRIGWPWFARGALRNALLGGAVLALLAGCDYFRAAQPEAPTGDDAFLPDYSDPDRTLETIANAIADKARTIGITAYTGAFAESTSTSTPGYHQLFWPTDVSNWITSGHTPPSDWGFALERNFYVRFVNLRGDNYRMEWAPDDANPDDVRGSQATIHRHYVVTTLAEDGSVSSTLAVGFADLILIQFPDGDWEITRWNDRIDPEADPNDPEQLTLGRRRLNTQ